MNNSIPTVLDLFSGAGGLSLGFRKVGFHILQAVDIYPPAVKTYRHNLGTHVDQIDLTGAVALPYADVLIGGPPCQGFSSAGLRQKNDHRNTLVGKFAEYVATVKPKAFVFENVEGFLTAEAGDRIIELLDPVIEAGYKVHLRKVNAANYGVPQHRKRVLVIGGLGWEPRFPQITHSAFGAPGSHLASRTLPPTPSITETLAGMPQAMPTAPGAIQGHYFRQLEGLELQRAIALAPGQTMRDLPESLQHESFRRRAFRRVKDGTPSEKRGGAPSGIKRLKPDEPSKAITGGMQGEFLHPFEHRPLTIRECARLQTFPDDFIFMGTVAEQMQLIGNAVPPLLAEHIASALMSDLRGITTDQLGGVLLSFVPTLSSGFSPALRHVLERVNKRYRREPSVERLTLWD
jgi:DNA (cytosine-5)-methyltransferase 1